MANRIVNTKLDPAIVTQQSTIINPATIARGTTVNTVVDPALTKIYTKAPTPNLGSGVSQELPSTSTNPSLTMITMINTIVQNYLDTFSGSLGSAVHANVADRANSVLYENIIGRPGFSIAAVTGDYNDLINRPSFASYATYTYVDSKITDIINGAPTALDTLKELATALGNDSSFASSITNSLSYKLDISTFNTTIASYATTTYVDGKATWTGITGKPSFATVATSGNYIDLIGKPTLGNVSTINKDDNSGHVLYGNGVFAPLPQSQTVNYITFNNGPTGAASTMQYGLGNLISWLDGGWTIGEFNGDTSSLNGGLGTEGIRIDPGIESNVGMNFPSVTDSVTQPVNIYSTGGGGIQLNTGSGTWTFDNNGLLTIPGFIKADNEIHIVGGSLTGITFNRTTESRTPGDTNSIEIQADPGLGAIIRTTRVAGDLTNEAKVWKFAPDGTLTIPSGLSIEGHTITAPSGKRLIMASDNQSQLTFDDGTTQNYVQVNSDGASLRTTAGEAFLDTSGVFHTPGGVTLNQYHTISSEGESLKLIPNYSGTSYVIIPPDGSGDALSLSHTGSVVVTAGSNKQWQFNDSGDLTVPNDILANPSNDMNLKVFDPGVEGAGVAISLQNRNADSGSKTTQFDLNPANIVLTTDFNNSKYQWVFDNTGNLTVPGSIKQGLQQITIDETTETVTIQTGLHNPVWGDQLRTWTFHNNGTINLPGDSGATLHGETDSVRIFSDAPGENGIDIETNAFTQLINQNSVIIQTNAGSGTVTRWTFGKDGNLSAPGNISASYFIGDGSQLTGIPAGYTDSDVASYLTAHPQPGTYSNTNVASYLTANPQPGTYTDTNVASYLTTATISTTGNITGAYIKGNGSQLTGLPASYANSNVATFLNSFGSNTITTTGNITAGNLYIGVDKVGNLALLNKDGNASNVLYGNGVFSAAPSGGGGVGTGAINETLILNNVAPSTIYTGVAVTEWSASYTGTGGQLLVSASISGYTSATAARTYTLLKNGSVVATGSFYFNATSTHLTLPTINYIDTTGSKTSATWSITLGSGLTSDQQDRATIRVTEYTGSTLPLTGANTSPVTGTISATTSGTATTVLTVAIPSAGTWQITGVVAGALNNGQECTFALFDGSGTLVANTETKAGYVGGGATYQGTGTGIWVVSTVGAVNYTIRAWGPGAVAGCTIVSSSDGRTYSRYVQLTGVAGAVSYGDSNVVTLMSSFGSNTITTTGSITTSNLVSTGTSSTGIGAVTAGVTNTILPNTVMSLSSNVNNYTQVTLQNKNAGNDATADYVLTSDNGSDTTNYLDLGIINSGYDNSTPSNSLGNIVYAADSYLYAQGNASATSQSGGNLAIGTTVPTKVVRIFAGGNTNSNIVATFNSAGMNLIGNISATGNVSAANFILNGQSLTATGLINSSYLFAQNNVDQTGIAQNTAINFQTTVTSNGTLITKASNTQFTLTAGQTYKLEAIIRRFTSSSTWGAFQWWDVTNGAWVGAAGFGECATSIVAVGSTVVATAYVTPSSNTTYELRQTTVNTIVVSSSFATIEITQVNPTVTLGAVANIVATGNITANNINGNVALTGNITGTSPNVSLVAGGYTYTFDNTGNFTLPTNGDLVFGASTTLTSGAGTNGNITINPDGTGQLIITNITPAQFGNTVSISGNLTASSNIRASGTVYGFELSSTESVGDEGGQVNLAVPQTNTSLQNSVTVDVYQNKFRIFEGSTNAKGVFVDLNKAPNGVGGELLYKASGFVNAGVDVTLGNLKARIPTSGNRSLQLSTVSGTYTVYGADQYTTDAVGGSRIDAGAPKTITTTPTYINSGYNFVGGGMTDTWVLMDTGAGLAWRITMIIGAGYNNNFISIERL